MRPSATRHCLPLFKNVSPFSATSGDPGLIRTGDLRFRKPPLYPPELRGLACSPNYLRSGIQGSLSTLSQPRHALLTPERGASSTTLPLGRERSALAER